MTVPPPQHPTSLAATAEADAHAGLATVERLVRLATQRLHARLTVQAWTILVAALIALYALYRTF